MFCPQCGNEIKTGKFCMNCGYKLPFEVEVENGQVTEEVQINEEVAPEINYEQTGTYDYKETENYNYRNLETKKPTGIRSIYILDFLIRLGRKRNIPMAIYLVLNVLIIGACATFFFQLEAGWGILAGLLFYIGSVTIALSPIGEAILRFQTGCKKIEDADILLRLEPIFAEVYYRAKKQHPEIPGNIRLYLIEDDSPNAFATGKRTVCVTRGLLYLSDEEIKGVLGHEFGHLVHQDTDRLLVVVIGNTIISAIAMVFQAIAVIIRVISTIVAIFARSDEGILTGLFGALSGIVMAICVRGFLKVWTSIGVLLCMKTSRDCEYEADAFSSQLGYNYGLTMMLSKFTGEAPQGLLASLASTHPESESRIQRLQQMNV